MNNRVACRCIRIGRAGPTDCLSLSLVTQPRLVKAAPCWYSTAARRRCRLPRAAARPTHAATTRTPVAPGVGTASAVVTVVVVVVMPGLAE